MTGLIDTLLTSLNASPMDVVNMVMGVIFALYVISTMRRIESRTKDVEDRNRESSSKIWSAVNENKRKYAALNAWTYGAAVAIRKTTGISLIKQSANGEGDISLNRDVD